MKKAVDEAAEAVHGIFHEPVPAGDDAAIDILGGYRQG